MSKSQREKQLRRQLSLARKQLADHGVSPRLGNDGLVARHESVSIEASFSGPLPPPSVLQGYEQAAPGAAERIITLAEQQAHHRMRQEERVVSNGINRSWAGLICGTIIALAGLFVAGMAVKYGHGVAGGTIATAVFGAGLWAFLVGTSSQSKERQKRAEASKRR